jgi:hypothetical protein
MLFLPSLASLETVEAELNRKRALRPRCLPQQWR